MHLFKTTLFCSLLPLSFHASTLSALQESIEQPEALMRIMNTLAKYGKRSYPKDVMKMITTTIDFNKDLLNTSLLVENRHLTCLALAVEKQQSEIVESILRHGASVQPIPVTSTPGTSIGHAIEYCQPEDINIFATLLAADENVTGAINSQKRDGSTILHGVLLAADDVDIDIIKRKACLLMYYGANPTIQDYDDGELTALDIAGSEGFFPDENDREDLINILQKNISRGSYYTRFLQEMWGIQGNVATYIHNNRKIYVPWAPKKTTSRTCACHKSNDLEFAIPQL
ncbi:MAG: hypothetical protein M1114_06220 [Candidatus Dependentiae bacterium]|nr:hypothetical protein [Candidatus Dependentiae bacterium]